LIDFFFVLCCQCASAFVKVPSKYNFKKKNTKHLTNKHDFQKTGNTFSLDVEGVGRVDKVTKEEMLPVEYEEEDGEGGEEEGEAEEEEAPEEENVEDDLMEVLERVGLTMLSVTLATGGIK
jgi:Ran GTPase-activating protein (RanGAP) involved in mRNA processing and transport